MFEIAERRFRTQRDEVEAFPAVRFNAGPHEVDATIFPRDGIRQAPPGPVDANFRLPPQGVVAIPLTTKVAVLMSDNQAG